ncbi:MAG TPA: mechanosensitive ion channel family protein [Solirubrobacteraceae bacterium]|jgi:small conductance mechanosensitive channel|nr:mechanosensitive ion channel family protein [Solirubrobacteraceae bacterium]
MPRQFKPSKKLVQPARELMPDRMFETRSDAWAAVGLSVDYSTRAVKRAQREAMILIPLFIAIVVVYDRRESIFGPNKVNGHFPPGYRHSTYYDLLDPKHGSLTLPLQIAVALALVVIGWAIARDFGRFAGPTFLRRMDPATAGTVGFVVRLLLVVAVVVVALSVAGANLRAIAVGGGFAAVIVGLAAQQTLGNAFAGMVLLSARPFRVGERVRLQAGAVGGIVEGIVSSLGLLYTTLTAGADQIMIPNSVVLAAVVVPLREPEPIDVRVRLSHGVRPTQVQAILDNEISTPTRSKAVLLEEVDGNDVVIRIQATPERADDGAKLADEVMAALSSVTGEHETQRMSEQQPDVDGHGSPTDGQEPRQRSRTGRAWR